MQPLVKTTAANGQSKLPSLVSLKLQLTGDAIESPTTVRHRELTGQVKTDFGSSDGIVGHRMVHAKLSTAGVEISVGTVASIMAENGWVARRMRTFKRTTIPSAPENVFKDLIGRDFTADTPGTCLVGVITYLRTGEGRLYLATVIGLRTRMIVGWVMADHMRASLCVSALTMDRDHGHLQPDTIFHSECAEFGLTRMLARSISRSAKKTPRKLTDSFPLLAVSGTYDNAAAETVMGLFKNEAVAKGSPFRAGALKNESDVVEFIFEWVHWYNCEIFLAGLGLAGRIGTGRSTP